MTALLRCFSHTAAGAAGLAWPRAEWVETPTDKSMGTPKAA